MPKAGLFAGEVTTAAPADGAITTKHKGYQWMEYGNLFVNNCNTVWNVATPSVTPDLHVGGDNIYGGFQPDLIIGSGVLTDGHTTSYYLPNVDGFYNEYGTGISDTYLRNCQGYVYAGASSVNAFAGQNTILTSYSGTGSAANSEIGIDGLANGAGLLTDTGNADVYTRTMRGATNQTDLLEAPITLKVIVKKDITATHWSSFYIGTDAAPNFIKTYFNQATGEINIYDSLGSLAETEVIDKGDWWEVYQQIKIIEVAGFPPLSECRIYVQPACSTDGLTEDVTVTGSLTLGMSWVYRWRPIGTARGSSEYATGGAGALSIDRNILYIDLANHDNTEGGVYFEWKPLYSQNTLDQSGALGNVEILSLNSAEGFLYYDYLTQKLTTTDGTNTATVDLVLVQDTKYRIGVVWGSSRLQVGVNGTWGTEVSYDGAFPTGSRIDIFREPHGPNLWREYRGYQIDIDSAKSEISTLMAGIEVPTPVNAVLVDTFSGNSGISLADHTPDVDTVGGGWSIVGGAIDITNGNARGTTVGTSSPFNLAVIDCGLSDCVINATPNQHAELTVNPYHSRLIFRYVDTNNYWSIQTASSSANPLEWAIYEYTGGVGNKRASAFGVSGGIPYDFYYGLTVTLNGTSIRAQIPSEGIDISTTSSVHQSSTIVGFVGIRWNSDYYPVFDDLIVEPLP